MSEELAPRLDPRAIEPARYAKWQEGGYFHVPASRVLEDGADPYVIVIPPPNVTAVLHMGRTAYRKYCVQCHGYSGKGDGTSATAFDPPPRDYTDAEVMNAITDLTIAETIRFGGIDRGFPNMPAFPHVNHDELVALVAYVRSLSRPGLASVQIGTVE